MTVVTCDACGTPIGFVDSEGLREAIYCDESCFEINTKQNEDN